MVMNLEHLNIMFAVVKGSCTWRWDSTWYEIRIRRQKARADRTCV